MRAALRRAAPPAARGGFPLPDPLDDEHIKPLRVVEHEPTHDAAVRLAVAADDGARLRFVVVELERAAVVPSGVMSAKVGIERRLCRAWPRLRFWRSEDVRSVTRTRDDVVRAVS